MFDRLIDEHGITDVAYQMVRGYVAPLLRRLPVEPFGTGRWFTPRVARYAQISVRTNPYSVPVRLTGRQVRALLHASELVVFDSRTEVA